MPQVATSLNLRAATGVRGPAFKILRMVSFKICSPSIQAPNLHCILQLGAHKSCPKMNRRHHREISHTHSPNHSKVGSRFLRDAKLIIFKSHFPIQIYTQIFYTISIRDSCISENIERITPFLQTIVQHISEYLAHNTQEGNTTVILRI